MIDPLRPLAPYETRYDRSPRPFAMPKGDDSERWNTWRAAFRARLEELLGGRPPAAKARFTRAPATRHDGYRREYVELAGIAGGIVPAWLLIPDEVADRAPAVIALHGHGYGMDEVVGLDPDGREHAEPQGYHQSFGVALCRRGMVVLAPELAGFGRRREPADVAAGPTHSSCQSAAWWGVMTGMPLLGRRVWETLGARAVLAALPEVDRQRIGIMGGSGGGAVALLAAALEPELRAAVICNYLCTFRNSILAMPHCGCNYVPGLLNDAEMYDIAALIAPRPILFEAGATDPLFPITGMLDAYERVAAAYHTLDVGDRIQRDVHEGGHQISGARAYDFLRRWLTA